MILDKHGLTVINTKEDLNSEIIQHLRVCTIEWFIERFNTDKSTGAGVFGPGMKHGEGMSRFPSIVQVELNAIDRYVQEYTRSKA